MILSGQGTPSSLILHPSYFIMRYCFALDLKDDPDAIAAYEQYHKAVWEEILLSIKQAGITDMEIYRAGNRLFMIMETDANFSFDHKRRLDAENAIVQQWETLMEQYQQRLPFAPPNEKWLLMKQIFKL
jgi:L-rhamnose mutarotase